MATFATETPDPAALAECARDIDGMSAAHVTQFASSLRAKFDSDQLSCGTAEQVAALVRRVFNRLGTYGLWPEVLALSTAAWQQFNRSGGVCQESKLSLLIDVSTASARNARPVHALQIGLDALQVARATKSARGEMALVPNLCAFLIFLGLFEEAMLLARFGLVRLGQVKLDQEYLPKYFGGTLWSNYAAAAMHLGLYDDALGAAVKATELVADPYPAMRKWRLAYRYATVAMILGHLRRLDEAEAWLTRARDEMEAMDGGTPPLPEIWEAEGLIALRRGNGTFALDKLHRAIELRRESGQNLNESQLNLARAYEANGEPAKARRVLEQLANESRKGARHAREQLRVAFPDLRIPEQAERYEDVRHDLEQKEQVLAELQAVTGGLQRIVDMAVLRVDSTGCRPYRVGRLAALISQELGDDPAEGQFLEFACRMLDLGCAELPAAILMSHEHLSASERDLLRTHPELGAALLSGGGGPLLAKAATIVCQHHERWDGTGYPAGLRKNQIDRGARLAALVDVFDALTHPRRWRPAYQPHQALRLMERDPGFDPAMIPALYRVVGRFAADPGALESHLSHSGKASQVYQMRARLLATLDVDKSMPV